MELDTAQVTNFRSIKDSGIVPIDDIICLVGKNESGKTNFLQALVRLHPAPGQPSTFDVNDDYSRAESTDMEHRLADPDYPRPVVVTATYRLDDADLEAVAQVVGGGVFTPDGEPPTITCTVDYAGKRRYPNLKVNEKNAIKTIVSATGIQGAPTTMQTITDFRTALDRVVANEAEDESAHEAATKALVALNAWPEGQLWQAVANVLSSREPMFLYFDQYATLPASGNVRHLLTKRESGEELERIRSGRSLR